MHAVVMAFCLALVQGPPPLEMYDDTFTTNLAPWEVVPLGDEVVVDLDASVAFGMPEILKSNPIETVAPDLTSTAPEDVPCTTSPTNLDEVRHAGLPDEPTSRTEVVVLRCPLGASEPQQNSYNGVKREVTFAFGGDVSA